MCNAGADKYMTPEYSSSIWSLYNFSWYTRVIDKGFKSELKIEELPVSCVQYDFTRYCYYCSSTFHAL